MKRRVTLILCFVVASVLARDAFAQSIADQLPSYVVGSFARTGYDPLPVLRNFLALESRMPDYEDSYELLGLCIEAWNSGDWRGARDRLLDHAQEVGSLNRFSKMDGLILTTLYFAYMDLQKKLGGSPLGSPRDQALAYLAMGQANYYITFPQVARSGPEDTRKALDYAITAIDVGQKLAASPGFYYYSALAHYLYSETYPKTHANYFSNLNTASWEITTAAVMLPDCPSLRFLQAQIEQWLNPLIAIEAAEAYMTLVPTDASAYYLRGSARFFAKQYDKCVEDLRKYLELAPKGSMREAAESTMKSAQEILQLARQ